MARIRLAGILASAKGKFGGAVFTQDKHGNAIMREKGEVSNPNTAPQVGVRGALGTSSKSYKVMPQIDAKAWGKWGSTQKDKHGDPLEPIAAYNRLAVKYRLVNDNATPPLLPPATDYLGGNVKITITPQSGGLEVQLTATPSTTTLVELLIQPLASANRKPQGRAYTTLAYASIDGPPVSTIFFDLAPQAYALAYRFVDKPTGQQTPIVPLGMSIVALAVVRGGIEDGSQDDLKAA